MGSIVKSGNLCKDANKRLLKFARNRSQDFATAGGNQHIVFDAHAKFAREVDSRLHGDHHAGLENLLR